METSKIVVLIGSITAFVGLMVYAVYLIFFKKPAANPQIISYVQTYMNQGYDADSIKQELMSQGYSEKDIDTAIQAANQ